MKQYKAEYDKHYREMHRVAIAAQKKQYYDTHKEAFKCYRDGRVETKREYDKLYYKVHKKSILKYKQMHLKTQTGRIVAYRHNAKRRRNLEWNQLYANPFDDSELVDWHHISDKYVVALPRDLHRIYLGKYHRENLHYVIKQIYEVI